MPMTTVPAGRNLRHNLVASPCRSTCFRHRKRTACWRSWDLRACLPEVTNRFGFCWYRTIPPRQIVGGPLQVSAGQSVDLNIDFDACASIVLEGNGTYRLKPTLTAGQVSANNSGIGGQVVDSLSKAPIAGK